MAKNIGNISYSESETKVAVVTNLRIITISDEAGLAGYHYRSRVYEGNMMVQEVYAIYEENAIAEAKEWIGENYQVLVPVEEVDYNPVAAYAIEGTQADLDAFEALRKEGEEYQRKHGKS